MIRALAGACGGAILIVAFAAYWLWFAGPAGAAEACRGQIVRVSWYGAESGKRTASGLPFDGSQLLAAHKSLPFHTRVRFTYKGRSIVLPIEDRGPYVRGRTFDLSRAAAERLGMIPAGVARLCAERL